MLNNFYLKKNFDIIRISQKNTEKLILYEETSTSAMVFLPSYRRAHVQPLVTTFLYTFNGEVRILVNIMYFCDL